MDCSARTSRLQTQSRARRREPLSFRGLSQSDQPRLHLGGDELESVLAQFVKCMPSVAREGPDLGRPAAPFDCVGPFRADKHVRVINLVYRAIARAVMRHLLLGAPDAH